MLDLGKGLRTPLRNHVVLGVNPSDFGCTNSSTPPEIDWGQGAPPDPSLAVLDALELLIKAGGQVVDSDNESADERGAGGAHATHQPTYVFPSPPVHNQPTRICGQHSPPPARRHTHPGLLRGSAL